jgi:uncharacterized membrane protein YidH (DUF202 family)
MKIIIGFCILVALVVAGIWGLATYEANRATVRLATAVQSASVGQSAATLTLGVLPLVVVGILLLGFAVAVYAYWRWTRAPRRRRVQSYPVAPPAPWNAVEAPSSTAMLLQQLQQQAMLTQTLMLALLPNWSKALPPSPAQEAEDDTPLLPEAW